MDFEVSSKRQQRGILTGLLLGRSFRRQRNFGIEHRNPKPEYVALKRSLLGQITGQAVGQRQWQSRRGQHIVQLLPQQIPLSRVLVQRLYQGDRKLIRTNLLAGLTQPGLALWFMDRGTRHYVRQSATGTIKGVEFYLNTLTSKAESETIAAYFRETWAIHWGLTSYHHHYRLRLGTQASRQFFALIAPYLLPQLKPLLDPSDNRTATT